MGNLSCIWVKNLKPVLITDFGIEVVKVSGTLSNRRDQVLAKVLCNNQCYFRLEIPVSANLLVADSFMKKIFRSFSAKLYDP